MDSSTLITLGILLAGVIIVIGGVLFFRLHAFLALILAAFVVSLLTPKHAIENYAIERDALHVVSDVVPAMSLPIVTVPYKDVQPDASGTGVSATYLVLRKSVETGRYTRTGEVVFVKSEDEKTATATLTAVSPQVGDVIIHPRDYHAAQTLAQQTIAARVAEGFGSTCTKIGILIAMASIIGMCLLESGAADRIVRSTLNVLGERGAPLSFLTSGFLLGIPVFFDTVFYLMIPLGKAMRVRTGRNYLFYVLTIVAGATMAHSLVPPTPGPLFVAEQLGVDIGVMILGGCAVGFFTVVFGYFYAAVVSRIWDLPLRESPEFSLEDLEKITQRDESELPPLTMSLLPIILPVLLIGGFTVLKRFSGSINPDVMRFFATLGDKNIALAISAVIALLTLIRVKRTNLKELADSIQSSLASAGVIILITAAGGAFGAVLKQTGVATLINSIPVVSPVMIIVLAFLITAAIRTAQGSATVAMITSVGILSGLAAGGNLAFHPVYLALAIGCGSKPIGWMNDSGFWVITKMSGMTEGEGLKYVTPMTSMMGVVGLGVIILGVMFFPMQ
jgi:GntP family gluconate:H+ symporter